MIDRLKSFRLQWLLATWGSLSFFFVGCRTTESQLEGISSGFPMSFYDPKELVKRCPPPPGLSADQGVSPAEGMFGVTCSDNWVDVPDAMDVSDLGPPDIKEVRTKASDVQNELDYLRLAYRTCPDRCVKKSYDEKGYEKYKVNRPTCASVCSDKVWKMQTNQSDKSANVFLEVGCTGRNWKSILKESLGLAENHCGTKNHIKVSRGLIPRLNLDVSKVEEARVALMEDDSSSQSSSPSSGSKNLSVSFYDPSRFSSSDRCPPPSGLNSSQGISPAEGLLGVSCSDNWVAVPNPWTVQDVESSDIQDVKAKGYQISSNFDYLNLAFQKCGGSCVKRSRDKYGKEVYEINLPRCTNVCQNKVYSLKTTHSRGKDVKVFIESACPAKHWKNVFKAAIGVDTNHCAQPNHIDISKGLIPMLGFDNYSQHDVKASVE